MFGQGLSPRIITQGNTLAMNGSIPFRHYLHGENIGLSCDKCHRGGVLDFHALMPSKADCMDCHRLPLTENPAIEQLDSLLEKSGEHPWARKSKLPEHVVFHHGVHASAGVTCAECHRTEDVQKDVYGGEDFRMETCIACHRRESFAEKNFKPAATYCGACHR